MSDAKKLCSVRVTSAGVFCHFFATLAIRYILCAKFHVLSDFTPQGPQPGHRPRAKTPLPLMCRIWLDWSTVCQLRHCAGIVSGYKSSWSQMPHIVASSLLEAHDSLLSCYGMWLPTTAPSEETNAYICLSALQTLSFYRILQGNLCLGRWF